MKKIFNELGFSFVIGNGNWIGLTHEIEFDNGTELRKWGWKYFSLHSIQDIYIRVWFYKNVFILSKKDGVKNYCKTKIGCKFILGFENTIL